MKNDYVRCYYNGGHICEDIPNVKLVINNLPGKYVFSSDSHGVATVAELYEDEDDVVNFKTENSTLEVELPYKRKLAG